MQSDSNQQPVILTVYFDGSCAPDNPGGIAIGAYRVLDENDEAVHQSAREIHRGKGATNNLAEWAGLALALQWIDKNRPKAHRVRIFGDSQLVIKQLNQVWGCRAKHLRPYCALCLSFLEDKDWKAEWLPRELNEEADQLAEDEHQRIVQAEAAAKRSAGVGQPDGGAD